MCNKMLSAGKKLLCLFFIGAGAYGCTHGIPDIAFRSKYQIVKIEEKALYNLPV